MAAGIGYSGQMRKKLKFQKTSLRMLLTLKLLRGSELKLLQFADQKNLTQGLVAAGIGYSGQMRQKFKFQKTSLRMLLALKLLRRSELRLLQFADQKRQNYWLQLSGWRLES